MVYSMSRPWGTKKDIISILIGALVLEMTSKIMLDNYIVKSVHEHSEHSVYIKAMICIACPERILFSGHTVFGV